MKKALSIAFSLILTAVMLFGCTQSGGGSGQTGEAAQQQSAAGYSLKPADTNGDGLITLGFAQVGAESGWRTANTQSYKDYFVEANGFKMVFLDANQDADKQKQDVRDLISQGVEVIDLAPVTDSGWEPILQEAKDAGIPLIISDRQLTVDENLYLTYFGGNMEEEGNAASRWLEAYVADSANGLQGKPINIVHLQGTIGSTAQKGRSLALTNAAGKNGWNIVYQQTGEFTQAKGQEVMESFLQQNQDFNVIYAENDDMTYGAVDALNAAGKDPKPYVIITFDGNKTAIQMVADGIIDCEAECNPLLGPQVGDLINKAKAGESIPKITYSVEGLFDTEGKYAGATKAVDHLPDAFGS
jgi:simple sugar transport system substrate-binding protein